MKKIGSFLIHRFVNECAELLVLTAKPAVG